MSDDIDRLNAEERELRANVHRAERARLILEDEMVVDAFDSIETALRDAIRESTLGQTQEREDAYRMMRLLDSFKGAFTKYLEDGKVADYRIAEIKDKRRTLMDRIRA
jgi:hypothetical protein